VIHGKRKKSSRDVEQTEEWVGEERRKGWDAKI